VSFSNKSFSVRIYLGFQKNIGKSAFFLLSCFSSQKLRRLWSARALSSKHEQLLPRLNGKERWYEETPSLKIKLLTRPFFFSLSSKRAPFPSFRKEQPPEFFLFFPKKLSLSDAKLSLSLSLPYFYTRKQTTLLDKVTAHSRFFDSLVEQIPAKYYLPSERDDDDLNSFGRFGQKKPSEKAEKKKRMKTTAMENKRAKLDPRLVSTNEEKQKKLERKRKGEDEEEEEESEDDENEARRLNNASEEESGSSSDEDEDEDDEEEEEDEKVAKKKKTNDNNSGMFKDMIIDASTPSKEEKSERLEALRKRLEKKIQDSREKRKASEHEKKVKDAKDWREQREKMKLEKKEREKRMKKIADAKKREALRNSSNGKKKGDETDDNREEPKMNLAFGNVDVDEVPSSRFNGKKKKETKRDLLSKALQREKDLADAGGDQTKEGKRVAEKHAWEASLKRARGEKVLDDPKLLRKSVKREEKKKQKSKEKWSERTKTVQDQQNAKKKKRKENIKAKADEKIEKNIDRREKKRNRPGFEGRSKGMIN